MIFEFVFAVVFLGSMIIIYYFQRNREDKVIKWIQKRLKERKERREKTSE